MGSNIEPNAPNFDRRSIGNALALLWIGCLAFFLQIFWLVPAGEGKESNDGHNLEFRELIRIGRHDAP
jgi:hypothetical protein